MAEKTYSQLRHGRLFVINGWSDAEEAFREWRQERAYLPGDSKGDSAAIFPKFKVIWAVRLIFIEIKIF